MNAGRTFTRLAIANRGEAAVRCIRTVKSLRAREGSDLQVLALYTEAERDAAFVRLADAAVPLLGHAEPVAAYLDADAVVDGLRRLGADAVWPGWGFLSEDAAFAARILEEGAVFLGPSPDAMRTLGDKIAAKRLAEGVGVPVIPWSLDLAEAGPVGFPRVLKAAAGGGGRGIRLVSSPAELDDAIRAARAEAQSAFGDERLFVEQRIDRGRHVEVQIAADGHGHVLALGCRDCSVQRRHQKLIEEAPPPGLGPSLLADLEQAAISLVAKVGYCGVGTVEFLVRDGAYSFLEVNPRLQVEHPITEATTGVDLVELQIRIARGERLPERGYPRRGAAIEVRLCAEDPDAGFLPAPGRVARLDLPSGPGVRVDTGVAAGGAVSPHFDSLVAKLIAWGEDRDQARARLACALGDLEVVLEGGATNKGFLLELLDTPELRAGGVDTAWLDRRTPGPRAHAEAALAVAAALLYQRRRAIARADFFADGGSVLERVPSSEGRSIELGHRGHAYALQVFAVGSWTYRVHLDGRVRTLRLVEERPHVASAVWDGRHLRVLHDTSDAGLRVEVEGVVHHFGWEAAGQVRAGTPAMLVALHVAEGDRVSAGQPVATLEAMKIEIGVDAPVAGVVRELRARRGQQVAAGDVLLVIEPDEDAQTPAAERLAFTDEPDPLALLFRGLADADAAPPGLRHAAVMASVEEIRRVLLGYDADPARCGRLVDLLEAPLPPALSPGFRAQLALVRRELVVFADVEQLFVRSPRASVGGEGGPSNEARMRMLARRIRVGGAGLADSFLELVGRALAHYGVAGLDPGPVLERAVLRTFASQRAPALRHRLVAAMLERLLGLASAGVDLSGDGALAEALPRIAGLRGRVPHAVADLAEEVRWVLFDRPALERQLPAAVADGDPLVDHLRRVYAPLEPVRHSPELFVLPDGRVLLAASTPASDVAAALARLRALADAARGADGSRGVDALELRLEEETAPADPAPWRERVADALAAGLPAGRCTVWGPGGCRTWVREGSGVRPASDLHGLHPETAARIDLGRLAHFELEPLEAPEDVYAFHGRSRSLPDDERIFVMAEMRAAGGPEVTLAIPAFEHAFSEAARTLRAHLGRRDERRRLQWNRISVFVAPEFVLPPHTAEELARRLFPATRHLGLDRVVVRLRLLDPAHPERPARPFEVVISDPTGGRMEIAWREPRRTPLEPAGAYQRRLVEARRRGLVYPYEIVRLLTRGGDLPPGRFEEYDLDPHAAAPRAVPVTRPYGENRCGIVLGVIETPTEKVPEGMRRVLVLSDPTRAMGSLGTAECDRVVAALDLAASLGVPVEWVPVSSGARIAMDSGTENLDATARVVRRIVHFTQAGGTIHVIVHGVNVGAQSYWNALATMLPHCRGALVMTPGGSMVLTGRAALIASGGVAAEDELAIGGYERVMGPNGEAQYPASDLPDAFRRLYDHYRYTYVVPGEAGPRPAASADPPERDVRDTACGENAGIARVGEIFDPASNPDRKRPFPMRALMEAVADRDGGWLERWPGWVGAETAIVWDAHLGGRPVCLIGIESRNVEREGYRSPDGPDRWTGGTLFPLSSKKLARALNAADGNRPVVVLANLSGFDGSPESMRKLQLEHGAEIARAVVNFRGPILFCVVSRYHGGAYVVFSKALNPGLEASALTGSFASVIGGGPAAAVVFGREARARAAADPRLAGLEGESRERRFQEVVLEKQAGIAAEFEAVHTVERARTVGSLDRIVAPEALRPHLIASLGRRAGAGSEPSR